MQVVVYSSTNKECVHSAREGSEELCGLQCSGGKLNV